MNPDLSAPAPLESSDYFPMITVDDDLWPLDGIAQLISRQSLPEPYRYLLAHRHHMTVTLEDFYQKIVTVRVVDSMRKDNLYSREIILNPKGEDRVILYGIVRIDLSCCLQEVAAEIVAEKTPLGHILIKHNILRRVEPTGFYKVIPYRGLQNKMRLTQAEELYGRSGVIFFDNRPVIAVLEILGPAHNSNNR
jgi:chorismate-pyruvate lyase